VSFALTEFEHGKDFGRPFREGVTDKTQELALSRVAARTTFPPRYVSVAGAAVKDTTTGAGAARSAAKASGDEPTIATVATIGAVMTIASFDRTLEPNMHSLVSIR
jgi:hypothetical protein